MTDKVQKIREEVERLQNELIQEREKGYGSDVDDACILELQNVLTYIDSLQEEPVSDIDFEKELYKAFGQVKDFTLGMRIAKRFYDMGKNSQEPVSEELEEEIIRYVGYSQEVDEDISTTMIRKAARHFANWQKKQMMAKAVDGDVTFDYYGDADKTYGCIAHDSFCLEDFGLKDRDKVRMILIKESKI